MKIIIYGASDDLVEVTVGDEADEFSPDGGDRWQADLVAPGGTEQMRVHCWFDDDGCWQVGIGQTIEDCQLPAWPVTIDAQPAWSDGPSYSARLTIEAPDGTRLDNIKPASTQGGSR